MTNAQARCLSRPFAPCPQVTFVIHPVRLPNAGAGLQSGKPHAASSTRIAEKTSWYIERIAPAQPPLYHDVKASRMQHSKPLPMTEGFRVSWVATVARGNANTLSAGEDGEAWEFERGRR